MTTPISDEKLDELIFSAEFPFDVGRALVELRLARAEIARLKPDAYPGKGHPWADFLEARARAIDWLFYRNPDHPAFRNDEEIARTLSMDVGQVRLIRTRDVRPGDNKGQVSDTARETTKVPHE